MRSASMGSGRNSKSSVLKDNARERKVRQEAAGHLELAVNVIQQWFTGEDDTVKQIGYLSGMIRDGLVDYTDHAER